MFVSFKSYVLAIKITGCIDAGIATIDGFSLHIPDEVLVRSEQFETIKADMLKNAISWTGTATGIYDYFEYVD